MEQPNDTLNIPYPLRQITLVDGRGQQLRNVQHYLKVLELFYQQYDQAPLTLQNPPAQNDHESMSRFIHTLKGASASVGMMTIKQLCLDYEEQLKRDVTATDDHRQRLSQALTEALQECRDLTHANQPSPTPTHRNLETLLAEIRAHLERDSLVPHNLLTELEQQANSEPLKSLVQLLSSFDDQAARELINELMKK
ncbi:Hpt domain-containing protein [Reinekea sp. G2M2-21]|uniref:Hpt domain-containing protein n=1 Tax=Reinekea sp. G2M2-21 TaxID=2788942 RepID=UPI0018ABF19E|nr:Hpt domain-containing protein [Reinekea sp. G2M2-21]